MRVSGPSCRLDSPVRPLNYSVCQRLMDGRCGRAARRHWSRDGHAWVSLHDDDGGIIFEAGEALLLDQSKQRFGVAG